MLKFEIEDEVSLFTRFDAPVCCEAEISLPPFRTTTSLVHGLDFSIQHF